MASSVAQPLERQFAQIPGVTADDLDQRARRDRDHAPVRPRPQHRRRRAGRAGRDQRRRRPAAAERCPSPPTYRKVNPADTPILLLAVHSDTLPLIEVDDYADTVLAQQICADRRRRPGRRSAASRSRRSASRSIRPSSPPQGLTLEDMRGVIATATDQQRQGHDRRRDADASRSTPTTSSPRPTTCNDVILAYRNGAPIRVRDVGQAVDGPENRNSRGLGQRQARRHPASVFKQPGANVIETVDRSRPQLPQLAARDPAGDQGRRSSATARTTIRASVADVAVHAGADHRAGGAGDLRCSCATSGRR